MTRHHIELGVNVDHVATLRQARRIDSPDPVAAAAMAELAGADQITVHLREDRRHIQDRDVRILAQTVMTRLNLEMGLADEIVAIALDIRPGTVTLVPERREEVTTEGGLDALREAKRIAAFMPRAREAGIGVSLFIDPEIAQVRAAQELGAHAVELHTGSYCEHWRGGDRCEAELDRLVAAGALARQLGLRLAAGHGLDYRNIHPFLAALNGVEEVNIGHSIVGRAVFTGIGEAVREMRAILDAAGR